VGVKNNNKSEGLEQTFFELVSRIYDNFYKNTCSLSPYSSNFHYDPLDYGK
jgi:hypothetical protein